MTVSTPYFDLVAQTKELRSDRIVALTNNIANAEQRIELLKSRPLTASRARRIARLETKNSNRLERIDNIKDEIIAYDAILPKDEFTPSFRIDPVTSENIGVFVTLTDSPYDDTYVGGTPFGISIKGRYCKTGNSGFSHSVGTWDGVIDATETIGIRSNRLNGDYSITVQLFDSNTRVSFYEQQLIDSDGVQLI